MYTMNVCQQWAMCWVPMSSKTNLLKMRKEGKAHGNPLPPLKMMMMQKRLMQSSSSKIIVGFIYYKLWSLFPLGLVVCERESTWPYSIYLGIVNMGKILLICLVVAWCINSQNHPFILEYFHWEVESKNSNLFSKDTLES